ncbi:hypothetical protein KTD19_13045 [Burkholderia multivorans]|uniref:hypothetical protein n=1 Tax=Burkholderia multivorans TaxID=87883 RepID=UPI000F4F2231|nr:hypothetical protein [Burkholderia multivorans]MBU9120180.1 hypothetical protein [Burkholderia multivorans]MBU9233314.1 hypothetical protein [Burkholderia multivorans]MCA8314898.1 hypothetical protein [Burkholderia multivorans]MDN7968408.1 hypothetical protein [Burkholderia multivorans]MEB2485367.1 hypothetical protein [Burkholderia multivorans]
MSAQQAGYLVGIECVIGKLITCEVSLTEMLREPPEAPNGDDGLSLNVAPRRAVVELPSIVDLDDGDRVNREKLLPDLPTLCSPLSPQDEEAFLSTYSDTPGRPAWMPVLVTTANIKRRERQQDDTRDHHRRVLQTEFAEGRVTAVNSRNARFPY